jgi:hypothetical protein
MESISLMSDYLQQHGEANDSRSNSSKVTSHNGEVATVVESRIDDVAVEDAGAGKEEKEFLRRLDWILMCVLSAGRKKENGADKVQNICVDELLHQAN